MARSNAAVQPSKPARHPRVDRGPEPGLDRDAEIGRRAEEVALGGQLVPRPQSRVGPFEMAAGGGGPRLVVSGVVAVLRERLGDRDDLAVVGRAGGDPPRGQGGELVVKRIGEKLHGEPLSFLNIGRWRPDRRPDPPGGGRARRSGGRDVPRSDHRGQGAEQGRRRRRPVAGFSMSVLVRTTTVAFSFGR